MVVYYSSFIDLPKLFFFSPIKFKYIYIFTFQMSASIKKLVTLIRYFLLFVTLEHKTSHKGAFFQIEIYVSYETE